MTSTIPMADYENTPPYGDFDYNQDRIIGSPFEPINGCLLGGEHEKNKPRPDEEGGEEDMDLLIEELESVRGIQDAEEELLDEAESVRVAPEDLLRTDLMKGLSDSEVLTRRKRYGLNKMKEEKENNVLKLLSFFVGPIQFVMEVRGSWVCLLSCI